MKLLIDRIFDEEVGKNVPFNEKGSTLNSLFGRKYYTEKDIRENWCQGVRHGIEIGLRRASLEGQILELNNNTVDKKHKEFLERFYQLADEYSCAIQYHPIKGMTIITLQHS